MFIETALDEFKKEFHDIDYKQKKDFVIIDLKSLVHKLIALNETSIDLIEFERALYERNPKR